MNRHWQVPSRKLHIENEWVVLTAVDADQDIALLYDAASLDNNGVDIFRFHVNVHPMTSLAVYENYLQNKLRAPNEIMYKVFSKRLNRYVGCVSLMNINIDHGSLEVGSIWYSKLAQKTEVNTNVMFLLFTYIFEELHYRRLEWKCNNLNEDSKRAALRLGFEYEGLFRQHYLSRGENRDTAWFSIIDKEWPEKKKSLMTKLNRPQLA